MDAPSIYTLAPYRLCHRRAKDRQDHRLIITRINLRLRPYRRPHGKKALKRLNLGRLDCSDTKQSLVSAFDGCLRLVSFENKDIETIWSKLRELVYNTALQVVEAESRKHQDWFDENWEEIKQLVEGKYNPASRLQSATLQSIRTTMYVEPYSKNSARCKTHG